MPFNARAEDTVPDFGHSLVGIKPFAYAGCISVFHPHDEGVTIHRQEDVRIVFLAPPIVQGPREESGLWSIPFSNKPSTRGDLVYSTQRHHHKPPTDSANLVQIVQKTLGINEGKQWMANNVYELPSIGQGIKWVHSVCGYPVKSTWTKAIRAGNFVGWPILTVENVHKHYTETE